jgi:hypothetical protein
MQYNMERQEHKKKKKEKSEDTPSSKHTSMSASELKFFCIRHLILDFVPCIKGEFSSSITQTLKISAKFWKIS